MSYRISGVTHEHDFWREKDDYRVRGVVEGDGTVSWPYRFCPECGVRLPERVEEVLKEEAPLMVVKGA